MRTFASTSPGSVRIPLCRRGFQPPVDARSARRSARQRELKRAREFRPLVRPHRFLARPPFDVRALSSARDGGTPAKGRRSWPRHSACRSISCRRGHTAGQRLRDFAFFDDPARSSQRVADRMRPTLGSRRAQAVARQSLLRFLRPLRHGSRQQWLAERLDGDSRDQLQRVVEVTSTVTIVSDDFRFTIRCTGCRRSTAPGTVYATDGDTEIAHSTRRLRVDHADAQTQARRDRGAPRPLRFADAR